MRAAALNMSAFGDADLSKIYEAVSKDPAAATGTYGTERVGKARALDGKIMIYFTQHWMNGTMVTGVPKRGCNPSQKKSSAKVLKLLGGIRGTPWLNAKYGGILNYYVDAKFNASAGRLRSVCVVCKVELRTYAHRLPA